MKQYIGCDAHARYSVFVSVDVTEKIGPSVEWITLAEACAIICRACQRKPP